jgi:hypothetical protein
VLYQQIYGEISEKRKEKRKRKRKIGNQISPDLVMVIGSTCLLIS